MLAINNDEAEQIWIGKAEVSRAKSCVMEFSSEFAGAFVWWAAHARTASDFEKKIEAVIREYGLLLLEFSHTQLASAKVNLSEELLDLVERAGQDTHGFYLEPFTRIKITMHDWKLPNAPHIRSPG